MSHFCCSLAKNDPVGLLQGFMINAQESGSNSPGAGTFSREFDQNKVPAVRGFYLGFACGKINIPDIPRPSGGCGCK